MWFNSKFTRIFIKKGYFVGIILRTGGFKKTSGKDKCMISYYVLCSNYNPVYTAI